jgi:hypothetical protein
MTVTFGLAASFAAAQAPTAPAGNLPTVYVQDFEAHLGDPSAGGNTSRKGPLSILRSARASEKATTSAGSLSGAIAEQFKAQGYTSKRISRDEPLPPSGWLVTGIFYAIDTQTGLIQMPTFLTGAPPPPNTQITVSVADLATNPHAPFIVFGEAEALRGQGPPAGWNPYVIAAKFVVNTVESSADIQKLAKEIVGTILQNRKLVEEKASAAK